MFLGTYFSPHHYHHPCNHLLVFPRVVVSDREKKPKNGFTVHKSLEGTNAREQTFKSKKEKTGHRTWHAIMGKLAENGRLTDGQGKWGKCEVSSDLGTSFYLQRF